MPLTEDEERAEYSLRMDQMTVNVEKMRFDIQAEIDRREALQRWETRKFAVQLLLGFTAAIAAGVALGRFWLFHL